MDLLVNGHWDMFGDGDVFANWYCLGLRVDYLGLCMANITAGIALEVLLCDVNRAGILAAQ